MYSFVRKIVASAMALTMAVGVSVTALAEDASPIAVQVNGTNLEMKESAAVEKDGSVFVPMRTIFEGLGSEVAFDGATNTVTATRGTDKVEFTVGGTEFKVEKDGKASTLTSQAASFVENGATYVPVRFVADALGAKVAWDAEQNTVVIVDTTKLASELSGKFTVMDKYMVYSKEFATKALKFTGTLNYDMKVADPTDNNIQLPVKLGGTVSGITESDKVNMKMAIKMDQTSMNELVKQATAAGESADEIKSVTDLLSNISMEMIMDMNTGKFYITFPGGISELNIEKDTWYELDLNALLKMSGMQGLTMAQLMQMNKAESFETALIEIVNLMPIESAADGLALKSIFDMYGKFYSDDAFKKEGNDYVSTYELTQDGIKSSMTMKLTTADDKVNGYTLTSNTIIPGAGEMKVTASQLNDNCKVDMRFNVDKFINMVFNAEMKFTDTTDKALSKPASNAKIVSIMDLLVGSGTPEAAATETTEVPEATTETPETIPATELTPATEAPAADAAPAA